MKLPSWCGACLGRIEGNENQEWVLIDYVNVVVHVFQREIREYYDIENLWGDAKITNVELNA